MRSPGIEPGTVRSAFLGRVKDYFLVEDEIGWVGSGALVLSPHLNGVCGDSLRFAIGVVLEINLYISWELLSIP